MRWIAPFCGLRRPISTVLPQLCSLGGGFCLSLVFRRLPSRNPRIVGILTHVIPFPPRFPVFCDNHAIPPNRSSLFRPHAILPRRTSQDHAIPPNGRNPVFFTTTTQSYHETRTPDAQSQSRCPRPAINYKKQSCHAIPSRNPVTQSQPCCPRPPINYKTQSQHAILKPAIHDEL